MGDHQVCNNPRATDVFAEDQLFVSVSSSAPSLSPPLLLSNGDSLMISAERWERAEHIMEEIVRLVQPTLMADQKRKNVIDYLQGLFRCSLACEVFPYGSVPLKTYLLDGDIDLTALSSSNADDDLASDIRAVLEAEEYNQSAKYEVKDVQFIDAEVKIVKCLIQDIVVDISFNQLGGLCTLCFLEQVDSLIGKNHLFKRSIVLIKAWCYYESRILGAHHGLISTYALETLVLYIFHLFHSSLNGPLVVLYRFLDCFSTFDWDNYCVSLNGPVLKASLPDIVAEVPQNGGDELLLSDEFLKNCMDMFSVPSRGSDANLRAFSIKHLNIIDPLKENNNLGRSVHKGNFYRIRSALKYGACKLGWILMLPKERMADELRKFFKNTLERHKSEDLTVLVGSGNDRIPETEDISSVKIKKRPGTYLMEVASSLMVSKMGFPANDDGDSGYHLSGDALELRTSSILDNGKAKSGHSCQTIPDNFNVMVEAGSVTHLGSNVNHLVAHNLACSCSNHESMASICPVISSSIATDTSNGIAVSAEQLTSLLDLSGDYDGHIRSLLYGLRCHGYAISPPVRPIPLSTSQFRTKDSGGNVCHPLQSAQNFHLQMKSNNDTLKSSSHTTNHVRIPNNTFCLEKQKSRGTGTYFPNTDYHPHRDRNSLGKGRNQTGGIHGQLKKHTQMNGQVTASLDANVFEEVSCEPKEAHHSMNGRWKAGSSDFHQCHPSKRVSSDAINFFSPSVGLDFGTFGHQPSRASLLSPEARNPPDSGDPCSWGYAPSLVAPPLQGQKQMSGSNPERVEEQPYHLRDEDEFPPLSF